MAWYRENARKLPWRENRDPYRIWISEIMLQQTRVEAVKPYFYRFLEELPDIQEPGGRAGGKTFEALGRTGILQQGKKSSETRRELVEYYGGQMPENLRKSSNFQGLEDIQPEQLHPLHFPYRFRR